MLEIDELANELKMWAANNTLEERSRHYFRWYLESYRKEEPQEFAQIFPDFEQHHLVIAITEVAFTLGNWPTDNFNYVVAHIPIVYHQKEIGWYEVVFKLSGEYLTDVEHYNVSTNEPEQKGA